MYRYFVCLAGMVLALPVLALIVLAFRVPITISGIGYLLACSVAVAGLIIAPWNQKFYLVTLVGVIVMIFVAVTRILLAGRAAQSFSMVTLPQGNRASWISSLIDEQDAIVFGEALFHYVGGDTAAEHTEIAAALAADYAEMRAVYRFFPSPVLSTYLNLQGSDAFDTILIRPEVNRHPDVAVIFLHGYMGNVSVQCWEIAQAVNRFGAVTVCPSTDWTGQWWQPRGKAILEATFGYLRAQGIVKFYLGGFSNGGFGISLLARDLKHVKGLSGLMFIDGISNDIDIRETGLPVLIIQGTQDERVPVTVVRQTAETIGDLATYVEIDSDHFLIIKKPKLVHSAIGDWLEKQRP